VQSQTVIRTEVRLVNLTVTAADASTGKLIADLAREDLEILEDGTPQKIEYFSRSADVELSLGLVMDVSGSQEKFFDRHRRDIQAFLRSTLGQQDRAMLAGFANSVRLVQDFTGSSEAIVRSAGEYRKHPSEYPLLGPRIRRDLGSAVYDGMYHTIAEKLAQVERGRRALLLFSDGEDNASAHHMMEVLEAAQDSDVVIFGVHYLEEKGPSSGRNVYGRSVMRRLAADTGGEYFEATDDLREAFRKIGAQLRGSYQVAYRSSNTERPGAFRNVTVSSKRPGVRLRHRSGYFVK